MYSISELREDLDQLWNFIANEHPKTFAFTPEADFVKLKETIAASIDRPLKAEEFHVLAAPMLSSLGCGHAYLVTPEGFWDTHPDHFFPLELRLLSSGVHLVADHGGNSVIPVGSKIIDIDGENAQKAMTSLRNLVTTDGFNETTARLRLGKNFAFYRALTKGFPTTTSVSWLAPGQNTVTTTEVTAISQATLRKGQRNIAAGHDTVLEYALKLATTTPASEAN